MHLSLGCPHLALPLSLWSLLPLPGREWRASELRIKSHDDLHKLWFLLLKERNMLLSDRLYYRQANMAQPDPSRLRKVGEALPSPSLLPSPSGAPCLPRACPRVGSAVLVCVCLCALCVCVCVLCV